MTIPTLKRIKVSSEQELQNWLSKNTDIQQPIMIVTCGKKSRDRYLSGDRVRSAVVSQGWVAGQSYTLKGNLVGQVISRA